MATFWRSGHWRGSSYVEGHWVTRYDFNKTSSRYSTSPHYSYALKTYESFTIPNVKCQCCGDKIYFYQSPYGGGKFFLMNLDIHGKSIVVNPNVVQDHMKIFHMKY